MRRVVGVLSAFALSWASIGVGFASDSPNRSANEEISFAKAAFEKREVDQGLLALQRAADQGSLAALLQIADIYNEGELVAADRLKACKIFSAVADGYAKVDRFYSAAELVAKAFRRTADCYAKGVDAPGWNRDMTLAADLFFHAGVVLQDPEALFELAKLYLSGEGIAQNTAMAIHLLDNAARKQFPPAQAMLGSMMWEGKVMKRRPAAGLALLMLGKERTSPENRAWIASLYDEAFITASKEIEEEAIALVDKWKSVHGDTNAADAGNVVAAGDVPAPSKSPLHQFKGQNLDFSKGTDHFGSQPTGAQVAPPNSKAKER